MFEARRRKYVYWVLGSEETAKLTAAAPTDGIDFLKQREEQRVSRYKSFTSSRRKEIDFLEGERFQRKKASHGVRITELDIRPEYDDVRLIRAFLERDGVVALNCFLEVKVIITLRRVSL